MENIFEKFQVILDLLKTVGKIVEIVKQYFPDIEEKSSHWSVKE